MKKNILSLLFVLFIISNSYTQKNLRQVEITTLSGPKDSGKLLCVSETMLVLWRSDDSFNWDQFEQHAVSYYASEIDQLIIKPKRGDGFKEGMFYGGSAIYVTGGLLAVLGSAYYSIATIGSLSKRKIRYGPIEKIHRYTYVTLPFTVPASLIGGFVGSKIYSDQKIKIAGDIKIKPNDLNVLKKNSLFLSTISLEQYSANKKYIPPYNPKSGEIKSKPWDSIIHFYWGLGRTYTNSFQNIADAFAASGLIKNRKCSNPISYKFCFEFNLINDFRFGIAMSDFNQEIQEINEEVWESLVGSSYDFFIAYGLDSWFPKIKNWCEVSIGAGVGYNSLSIEGNLFVFGNESNYKTQRQMTSPYIRGNIDFLLTRRITFQFTIEGRVTPKVDIPVRIQVNPETNEVRQLNAHTINYSAVDLSMGLRFHF